MAKFEDGEFGSERPTSAQEKKDRARDTIRADRAFAQLQLEERCDIALDGVATRLELALEEKGWTKADLSRATGLPLPTIANIFRKKRCYPHIRTLWLCCRALEISADKILGP